jgi:hypothetical protein
MSRTKTPDLGAQIAQQRDRLTESVGALADKVDVGSITDKIDVGAITDKIDTDAIRNRAESGLGELLDNATDSDGRPKRGLLIGLVLGVLALVVARRVLS